MPEPYGSPEFRESLKFPATRVGAVMEQVHDGLVMHGGFGTAIMEDGFRRIGMGKPGEKPTDPIPFRIGSVDYTFSSSPRPRKGFVVDETIGLQRGGDSLLLQVSHGELEPTQVKDEAVLKSEGRVFKGEEAIKRIPTVFPEFMKVSSAQAA